MTLARLLIRIEGDDSSLAKALSKSVDRLESFTNVAEKVGRTLLLAVTLPLVGMGASAISAAADMDSLKKAMDTVTGSSAETAVQIERLQQLSKSPGLGFREAIQGSVNLQAVGFSAGVAERAMKAFANAIATTGGRKDDFDRVLFQLTQMAAVGKVLGADLRPIIQTAPAVARALNELFGTTNAEAIAEQTTSFQQFFDLLIPKLEQMGQVEGGAANALDNFSDAAFRARVAIGDKLLPAFLPIIEAIANMLEGLDKVSPATIRSGIAFAAVAAAAGPVILALTGIATAVGTLTVAFGVAAWWLAPAGIVLVGLGLLAKRFIENKLESFAAADGVDMFTASLNSMTQAQLKALEAENMRRTQGLKAMPQTEFIKGSILENSIELLQIQLAMKNVANTAGTTTPRIVTSLEAQRTAFQEFAADAGRLAKVLDDPIKDMRLYEEATTRGRIAMDLANQRMRAQRDQLGEIASGYRAVAEELREALGLNRFLSGADVVQHSKEIELQMNINLKPVQLERTMAEVRAAASANQDAMERTWAATEAARRSAENLARTSDELMVAFETLKQQFTNPGQTGKQAFNMLKDAALSVAEQLSPLGMAAYFLSTLMEGMAPAIEAFLTPIAILAKAFLPALMAILEALFPVLKVVGIAFTYVGQAAFAVYGALQKGIGSLLVGIGNLLNKLPGSIGNPIKAAGEAMLKLGQGSLDTAKALGEARRELEGLDWDSALSATTDSMNKLNEAVIGAVQGFKIAAARQAATSPVAYTPPTVVTSGGTVATSGGIDRREPVTIQSATFAPTINFPEGGNGKSMYRAFYEELANQVRSRGPSDPARLLFESMPSPA